MTNNSLACCICLVTDVKLFDVCSNDLQNAYEIMSGCKVMEGGCQYTCSYCGLMLRKFEAFRRQCMDAHNYLMGVQKCIMVSSDLQTDKKFTPYERSDISCDSYDMSLDIKEETGVVYQFDDGIDNGYSDSDDEFLKKSDIDIKSESPVELDNADLLALGDHEGSIDIVYLSKQQQIQEVLDRKESYNYRSSMYKCEKCYKGFLTENTFSNHMVRHDPLVSGSMVCDVCQCCWPDKRSLNTHLMKAHQRQYHCKLCTKVSKTRSGAKEHSKYHLGLSYTCKVCNARFDVKTSYFTHLRLQHPSDHCCDECGESFVSDKGLGMHKKRAHRSLEKLRRISLHTCPTCDVDFTSPEALDKHTDITDHDACGGERACVKCGDNFPSEAALYQHLKSHQAATRVVCHECEKSFTNEHAFASHYQRVHLRIKRLCRPEVRRALDLVCEVCGKKCCSRASLVCHQRTHTGEKPYRCPECPKTFSVQQRLQIHVRTHTGESPFQCALCPKAFKHKAALNRHHRVHSGARPYHCPHCTKSFSQSNSMKMHIRTVHLKMPCPYKHKRSLKGVASE